MCWLFLTFLKIRWQRAALSISYYQGFIFYNPILGMGLLEGRGMSGAVAEVKDKFLTVYLVTILTFIFVFKHLSVLQVHVHVFHFDESLKHKIIME